MAKTTEFTSFTRDIQGRFLCNDFSESEAWRTGGGRPFDVVVIGGGTFGGAIAEHLWFRLRQAGGGERVLVLETGLFALPEHVQNTAIQGLDAAPPSTLDKLHQANPGVPDPLEPVNEVWGIPWRSATDFPGLAFCIGGRSLYWGGWSPRLLPAEVAKWPSDLVADLNARYFGEASRQIGVTEANDFIFGELHTALRDVLAGGLSGVGSALSPASLPDFPDVNAATPIETLRQMLGLPSTDPRNAATLRNLLKLEAPLAVQARSPHAGFFPLNKFSTVPLLMKAARAASTEGSDDAHKSFMVLPGCHAIRIRTRQTAVGAFHVTGVDTNLGFIELAPNGVAIIALGTIESARLAAVSFENSALPSAGRIGRNLIAHLRSNLVIRVPRTAIAGLNSAANELQTSALFVKGRHASADGTRQAHFHIQITATGGNAGVGAENELFKKIPDVDFLDALSTATDTHVAIALRGIGEMQAADPANLAAHPSSVTLDSATDEFGAKRAFVTLQPTAFDNEVWAAMDQAMVDTAKLFGATGTLLPVHDGMGTTHHETGTLAMGNPPTGVTSSDGRFHGTDNLYAAGPCLFPTIGSPNPMLTGIAVARRTGDRIVNPPAPVADPGFTLLFDGATLNGWQMSTIRNQPGRDNPGRFVVKRGALESQPGTDLGLLWHTTPTPRNFVLKLEWLLTAPDDNSGVFIRFPDPEGEGYDNTAWVGVNLGFEIQIDEVARPDGAGIHRTGAIYTFKAPGTPLAARNLGEWNQFVITANEQIYDVVMNGVPIISGWQFTGDPAFARRAKPSTTSEPRFIGLQTHTGRVLFRNVQMKPL